MCRFLEVSSLCFFSVAMCTCIHVHVFGSAFVCVCAFDSEMVARSSLSAARMDGDIPGEMRGGEGSSKGASRWPGRMGAEKCVSGLIVPLMSLQAVTPLCGTPHSPSVRVR